MSFVLNGLSHTRMGDVVVIAEFAEGISAAFHATVSTDPRSAITTLRHGSLAAWHTYVAVTGYVLDLTMHSLPPRKPVHNNASRVQVPDGVHVRIILHGLPSENNYGS